MQLEFELRMLKARQNCIFCLIAIAGLSIIVMYPTELIWRHRATLGDQSYLKLIIFYLNWAGVYHSSTESDTAIDILNDIWGYLVILAAMFTER